MRIVAVLGDDLISTLLVGSGEDIGHMSSVQLVF